jgi:predicted dithiol-disulfide oxidoreductase (DUF899 family)
MTDRRVGTREEWLAVRVELLEQEKELTRRSDELARRRLELPWVPVETEYRFDTEDGPKTLAELFDGRSQLLVYHLMFHPDDDAACPGCTFFADQFDGAVAHLNQHDNFGTPRRAELSLHEDELMGLSAFALEDGVVYHTYSAFDRGTDGLNIVWQLLDVAPKGRFKAPTEDDSSGDWPRRRYEYEDAPA